MKKPWIVVIAISAAVFLFVVVGAVFLTQRDLMPQVLPGSGNVRSTSMELVDIDWKAGNGGHLHLKIPRAYLAEIYNNGARGPIDSFTIETGLPDLKPRPAAPPSKGEPGSAEWNESTRYVKNGLRIAFRKPPSNITPEQYHANSLAMLRSDVERRQAMELPPIDGLLRFQPINCLMREKGYVKPADDPAPSGCRSVGRQTRISEQSGPDWVHMLCTPILTGAPGPIFSCEIQFSYNSYFITEMMIRNTELNRWKDFQSATRTLIRSFEVSEK